MQRELIGEGKSGMVIKKQDSKKLWGIICIFNITEQAKKYKAIQGMSKKVKLCLKVFKMSRYGRQQCNVVP